MDTLLDALADRQNPSGLYDIGNLDSPPDTSFVISDLGLGYDLLRQDAQPATVAAREKYAAIMRRSARSLAEGGVHTPNHRWEICKALAHLNHLWPSRLLMARINDWLGEGIDQDAEGEYSERSPNYASEVTNRSLVTIARLADKPRLLGNVRRNLAMTLYRLEVNGEVETVQSRRQDQTGIQDVWKYLMHFRELALRDRDRQVRRGGRADHRPGRRGPRVVRHQRLLRRRVPGRGARLPRPHGRAPAAGRAGHPVREVLQGLAAGADPPRQHHRQHLRRHRLAQPPGGLRRATHHHSRDRVRAVHQPDVLQAPQGRGDPGFGADVTPVLQHRTLPQ